MLTHSQRSEAQLREGLVSRDVEPSLADEIIERYREVGLLDDEALAAAIARTRHRERGRSRRAVGDELRRKGFAHEHIEAALAQITADDEREAATELARRRWGQLGAAPHEARVRRVVGMLGRRGYPPSLAFDIVKSLQRADTEGDT